MVSVVSAKESQEATSKGEATCSFCNDSGMYGYSTCTWCDGVPKPVKKKAIETGLSVRRRTDTQFLVECSSSLSEDPTETLTEPECMLCVAALADVVLLPCGHGGFCQDCTRRQVSQKSTAFCPLCRGPIEAFLIIDPKYAKSPVYEAFQVQVSSWST